MPKRKPKSEPPPPANPVPAWDSEVQSHPSPNDCTCGHHSSLHNRTELRPHPVTGVVAPTTVCSGADACTVPDCFCGGYSRQT